MKRLDHNAQLYREEVMSSLGEHLCQDHYEALSYYCLDCEEGICAACFPRHNGHRYRDISAELEAIKAKARDRTDKVENIEKSFSDLLKEYQDLQIDIQKHGWKHVVENRKTQDSALRKKRQRIIEDRYVRLHDDRLAANTDLNAAIFEIQELKKKKPSASSSYQHALQTARIDERIWNLEISLSQFKEKKYRLYQYLENDEPLLKQQNVKESSGKEAQLLEKVKQYEEIKHKIDKSIREIRTVIDDIKSQEACEMSEKQRAYEDALKALATWWKSVQENVIQKHKTWLDQCDSMITYLQTNLVEIECFVIRSIQESKDISVRIADQMQAMQDAIKKQELLIVECKTFLNEDPVPLIYLALAEKVIKKPMITFTKVTKSTMKIKEDGLVVEIESPTDHAAFTNGSFQIGHYYWEYEVTVKPGETRDSYCRCVVGVHARQPAVEEYVGGRTYWGISVHYYDQKFKCVHLDNCNDIVSEYENWNPFPGRHHLGVYIDCENRVMTIIDCSQNKIIWSQKDIDVSKPLVPNIVFKDHDRHRPALSASVRLIRDNATLNHNMMELFKSS